MPIKAIRYMQSAAKARPTTVIDVTYMCDAACRYCQWGDSATPGRVPLGLKDLLIPKETLANLGTRKIVISGGEPRLHPNIKQILGYYGSCVDDVVIMTNGYGLTPESAKGLMQAGATGITVSLDSADSIESFLTRSTPPNLHKQVLKNLQDIASMDINLELGINSTVSHITANWNTVRGLLELAKSCGAGFVKFQPIFDDGFASKKAPELLLSADDAESLRQVASKLGSVDHPKTNPPKFWSDAAEMAAGRPLPASQCSLGPGHSMSVRGDLSMCYWVQSSSYGSSSIVKLKSLFACAFLRAS